MQKNMDTTCSVLLWVQRFEVPGLSRITWKMGKLNGHWDCMLVYKDYGLRS